MSTDRSDTWRRACGCVRTSEKLKQLLKVFPEPPPPTPTSVLTATTLLPARLTDDLVKTERDSRPICNHLPVIISDISHFKSQNMQIERTSDAKEEYAKQYSKTWELASELISLLQLSVTATALAVYYLIYCYMQLIYYALRSAVYFHNADGPMKLTIGVVTVTSLIIGFHVLMRMEKLLGLS